MNNESTVVVLNKIGTSILCVIDLTEASKDALLAALDIASSTKSKLTVLYPYRLNQPRSVPDVTQWKKSIEIDATDSFSRMTNTMFSDSDVLWDFKPEVGFVDDRVEAYSEKHDVGVVVMSNQLARTSDGAFLETLEKLKCPLLIVPGKRIQEL
ncbi:MAG: universal stress protein [Bacteroidota bacterium]